MQETYTYPFFFRLIYRYGNLAATFVLILYMLPLLNFSNANMAQKIYAAAIVVMIFFLNRYFIRLNKNTPYKIEIEDGVITGSDFFLSAEKRVTYPEEITDLRGGVFEGKARGMMRICTGEKEMIFYHSLTNADKLEAFLISKADKDIYDRVVKALKANQPSKK